LGGMRDDFNGYCVLGHRIEFFGVCPQCKDMR
jgi:Fe2+ or Zn2+ uptake regulation protein